MKQQVEKAVIFSEGDTIKLLDITAGTTDSLRMDKSVEEKTLILETLEKTGRNISATAKLLNISRPTLYSKMNKYNL